MLIRNALNEIFNFTFQTLSFQKNEKADTRICLEQENSRNLTAFSLTLKLT